MLSWHLTVDLAQLSMPNSHKKMERKYKGIEMHIKLDFFFFVADFLESQ